MRDGEYIVTLTATLAYNPQTSMFPYAQLYIMKNGKLTALDHYLLVSNLKIETTFKGTPSVFMLGIMSRLGLPLVHLVL